MTGGGGEKGFFKPLAFCMLHIMSEWALCPSLVRWSLSFGGCSDRLYPHWLAPATDCIMPAEVALLLWYFKKDTHSSSHHQWMVTQFKWHDEGEEKLLIMVRQKADSVMIQLIRLWQFRLQSRMLPWWEENWVPRTSTWHAALNQKFQGGPLYHQALKLIKLPSHAYAMFSSLTLSCFISFCKTSHFAVYLWRALKSNYTSWLSHGWWTGFITCTNL